MQLCTVLQLRNMTSRCQQGNIPSEPAGEHPYLLLPNFCCHWWSSVFLGLETYHSVSLSSITWHYSLVSAYPNARLLRGKPLAQGYLNLMTSITTLFLSRLTITVQRWKTFLGGKQLKQPQQVSKWPFSFSWVWIRYLQRYFYSELWDNVHLFPHFYEKQESERN